MKTQVRAWRSKGKEDHSKFALLRSSGRGRALMERVMPTNPMEWSEEDEAFWHAMHEVAAGAATGGAAAERVLERMQKEEAGTRASGMRGVAGESRNTTDDTPARGG